MNISKAAQSLSNFDEPFFEMFVLRLIEGKEHNSTIEKHQCCPKFRYG